MRLTTGKQHWQTSRGLWQKVAEIRILKPARVSTRHVPTVPTVQKVADLRRLRTRENESTEVQMPTRNGNMIVVDRDMMVPGTTTPLAVIAIILPVVGKTSHIKVIVQMIGLTGTTAIPAMVGATTGTTNAIAAMIGATTVIT